MMRALLAIRFRALLASLTRQAQKKGKNPRGSLILYGVLYLYVGVVVLGMMGTMFYTMAPVFHSLSLDWVYFAIAGLIGLSFALLGNVFTTQSQLYDSKDNNLLLSMPIPPRTILLSRMIPLLAMNLVFTGLIMLPAMVVYAITIQCSAVLLLLQVLGWVAITLFSQAVTCLLGWLLHLMLKKMSKSLASVLYMVIFLGAYFYIYGNANQILTNLLTNASIIADVLHTWIWPLYALGSGCVGAVGPMLVFLLITGGIFALVFRILSRTFLRTAGTGKKAVVLKSSTGSGAMRSPLRAISRKESRKFLTSPVYLTNMGLGILMTAAMMVAGVVFRNRILSMLSDPMISEIIMPLIPLYICGLLAFMISTMNISTPSVSLEGKNLWILKSMPISGKQILLGKLRFHILITAPIIVLAGLVLTIAYGCSLAEILLVSLTGGLLACLNGLLGILTGLKWATFDYISEAYPCKQSVSVVITMFSTMGVALVFGVLYLALLMPYLSVAAFLGIAFLVLSGTAWFLYRKVVTWGVKKWNLL